MWGQQPAASPSERGSKDTRTNPERTEWYHWWWQRMEDTK
jgi:hypothetical protein